MAFRLHRFLLIFFPLKPFFLARSKNLERGVSSGIQLDMILATIALPISRDAVAAGEGALQT